MFFVLTKNLMYDWSIVFFLMFIGPCIIVIVAGFSLQHEYHSNPTTPNLQHTSNQEQYDQCGNLTE